MADLLDFRLSPKMYIKIKVIREFLLNYNVMCRTIDVGPLRNSTVKFSGQ